MKSKLLPFTLVGLAIFSVSASSWAACSLPSGFYLEYNWGATRSMAKSYPGVPTVDNSGTGWNGSMGYKFMPYVAVEGGYTRYANTRLQNSAGTTAADDSHYAVDIAAKGILPIYTSGFELFAKVGVVRISSSIGSVDAAASAVDSLTFNTNGQSAMGLYLGGGVDYAVTKSLAINTQYARANGNSSTGNMDLVSIGLSFTLDPLYY
jgi:opacity protein-like surface antigen